MVSLPRLVIAAPSTGQGKTTIATGLMAALRQNRLEVSGHKVGPDYIDPGYHALATGRPGRNLDPHLVGEEGVARLLLHGALGVDIAVIEGVMGLYDGRLGTDGYASTAHVAHLTRTPVVLVIDVARMSRTAAAIAAGMAAFDPELDIAGVILNRTGSPRNDAEITRAMERTGLPVLGEVPRDESLAAPSRHLGLVPAAERTQSATLIHHLGRHIAQHLDLDALLSIARNAPPIDATFWQAGVEVRPTGNDRPVIAVAGGRAFTFRYAETDELLRAAGCELVPFDPLADPALPAGTQGIYLGGGFPETYAAELARNQSLVSDIRAAVEAGVPTVAECAGLLYLCQSLDGAPLIGVLPASASMSERLTLRYPIATACADSLLTRAGEQVTGHEFHRTQTTPLAGQSPAWAVDGTVTGFATETLHASYLHIHWAGHPQLAQRFADAARDTTPHHGTTASAAVPSATLRDPLRHHGDAETDPALLDFAVNVYAGPRPVWLERALRESLDGVAAYPDAAPAAEAIAARHGRAVEEVLPTAGAAEAFGLIARLRRWTKPVVIHPQFTEPHAALEQAGHEVTTVLCRPADGFALDPAAVPSDADLVIIGNPTNPTGVLHPPEALAALQRPNRLIVVDEAFLEPESLARPGVLVLRSLTKLWSIPGIRAGYVLGPPDVIAELAREQTPWSVSTPAIAAMIACSTPQAAREAAERSRTLVGWREHLEHGLTARGIEFVPSVASFVLARLGVGTHATLRTHGIAVRRADTFPGLDDSWVRLAVRPPDTTDRLLAALDHLGCA